MVVVYLGTLDHMRLCSALTFASRSIQGKTSTRYLSPSEEAVGSWMKRQVVNDRDLHTGGNFWIPVSNAGST